MGLQNQQDAIPVLRDGNTDKETTAEHTGSKEAGSGSMQSTRQVWRKVKGVWNWGQCQESNLKWRTLDWKLPFLSILIVFHLKMSPHGPFRRIQFNLKIYPKELFQSLIFYSCNSCIFGAYDLRGRMVGVGHKAGVASPCPLAAVSLWGTHFFISCHRHI